MDVNKNNSVARLERKVIEQEKLDIATHHVALKWKGSVVGKGVKVKEFATSPDEPLILENAVKGNVCEAFA